MSDREKEIQREINNILGFDANEAVETMLSNLEDGVLMIPHITDEQKKKIEEVRKKLEDPYEELPRLADYDMEVRECRSIFIDRNRIYKNAFEELGLIGTVSTLLGDCQRLKNMIYRQPDHGRSYREQIEDKLMDVVNQAVISLMMLHEDNFEGK